MGAAKVDLSLSLTAVYGHFPLVLSSTNEVELLWILGLSSVEAIRDVGENVEVCVGSFPVGVTKAPTTGARAIAVAILFRLD